MKEKLMRFMQGRYGVDTLTKFLLIVGLILVFISAWFTDGMGDGHLHLFQSIFQKCDEAVRGEPGISFTDL